MLEQLFCRIAPTVECRATAKDKGKPGATKEKIMDKDTQNQTQPVLDISKEKATELFWQLVYAHGCLGYIYENYPIAYRECGADQLEQERSKAIEGIKI